MTVLRPRAALSAAVLPAALAMSLSLAAPTPASAFKLTPAATPERVGECQGILQTFAQYTESVGTDMGPQWRQARANLDIVWERYDNDGRRRANDARRAYRQTVGPLIEREGQYEAAKVIAGQMSRCAELFYAE